MAGLNLNGKIGGIDKKYVVFGGAALAGILVIVYFRAKKQSKDTAANTGGQVTDPAGNVCAALDPNSGYCPGTAEDAQYQGTLLGTNAASYVGGQIIGYDQYGNPVYSGGGGSGSGAPGGFVNNAEWAQAAQQYLIQNEPSADPGTIGSALGNYITGQTVTANQQQIIEQAIAFEGYPPVGGPNGFPPSIKTSSGGGGGGGGGGGQKPAKVTGITITGKSTISVQWKPAKLAQSYEIGISPAPHGGASGVHNIGARTQYNISGIQKGKTYTVTVIAVNSAGKSPASTKSFKGQ